MNITNDKYPRLDSLVVVEKLIDDTSGSLSKRELFNRLSKKMDYKTFNKNVSFLLAKEKIEIDTEGKVSLVWHPEIVQKYLKKNRIKELISF